MSAEAFKVAVEISLKDGVTKGLALMGAAMRSTHKDAKALEARLTAIGKNALVGGTMIGAGLGIMSMFKGPLEEAKQYQILVEKFRQYGLGDVALRDAEKFVEAQDIAGASRRDMLRYFVEAQGVFRESGAHTVAEQLAGAKLAAPMMAKISFASQGLDEHAKKMTEAKQLDMLRFVEQAGGLGDPKRFNALMNAGFKAIQSSGGNVDFSQYRQFMARAGTAGYGLTDRSLFADLEPVIGELKGSTAGFALRTAFNRLNGIIKLPNQVTHDLMKMGIWDQSKVQLNSQGGIKRFNGNPLVDSALFASSPVDFYKTKILPMYQKQGFTDDQRRRENALIFGSTGGAMFNLIDKQMQAIMRSRTAFDKARGVNGAYDAIQQTYAGQAAMLDAKWKDLLLTIGKSGGVLDIATAGLKMLNATLASVNKFAKDNPILVKVFTYTTLIVGSLLTLGGAALMVRAGFMGLQLIFGGFPRLLMMAATAGRAALVAMGPLGWAILAIGTVGLLVWNNWREIWSNLKLMFGDMVTGFKQLFSGDILGALGSFAAVFLRGWQTIFNTLIAGLNTILPQAWQLGKMHFADDFDAWRKGTAAVPGKSGQTVQVHTTVNMDGRKVAEAVSGHQARAAGRPAASSGRFDPARAQPFVAMGAMR